MQESCKKKFYYKDISNIITYSSALMGIAALVILICHSNAWIDFPNSIQKLKIVFGMCAQYGVKIFFFLSAIRLFFSMKKNDNIADFYKKRLVRVLIPYITISLLCLSIKYFVISNDFWKFICDFFLFGYYMDGKSTWFIAAILPMYFIYPLLYKMRLKYKWFSSVSIISYFLISLIIAVFFNPYYNIIINMVGGGFAFLLGLIIAPYIYDKKKANILILLFMLAAYILTFVLKINRFPAGELVSSLLSSSLPIMCCYFGAWILDKLPKIFDNICSYFGKMSLELYLLGNVTYIMANFGLKAYLSKIEPMGILFYFITVIVIILLAIVFFKLNNSIIKLIYANKKTL